MMGIIWLYPTWLSSSLFEYIIFLMHLNNPWVCCLFSISLYSSLLHTWSFKTGLQIVFASSVSFISFFLNRTLENYVKRLMDVSSEDRQDGWIQIQEIKIQMCKYPNPLLINFNYHSETKEYTAPDEDPKHAIKHPSSFQGARFQQLMNQWALFSEWTLFLMNIRNY